MLGITKGGDCCQQAGDFTGRSNGSGNGTTWHAAPAQGLTANIILCGSIKVMQGKSSSRFKYVVTSL